MHVHFEDTTRTRSDCTVQALSWMGKVPESLPDEDGWKLNRLHYYQEGWLASGNSRGIIGVTFTACHCKKNFDQPPRTNFNLRGHRNEVALVKWNEPYQKLATCDVTGVIFVWIKHEGRWSIELINDRSSQVTDFSWSHDGRMALICYRDGFVLVGSVAGQRYWSSMLTLDGCTITCGIWSPDDTKVMFGTTNGEVVVMSSTGAMLAQVTILDSIEIVHMSWSCPKFYLDEQDSDVNRDKDSVEERSFTLAVGFKTGTLYLMANYDDVCPRVVHTGLTGLKMEWSNDGEVMAVGGFVRLPNLDCHNELRFYTRDGRFRYSKGIPSQGKPITALTWGHNDKRLYVAVGCHIHTAWVTKKVALLQFMCRRCIQQKMKDENTISKLPLPPKLRASIAALFSPTIKGYIPDPYKLREFVCIPPPGTERLHCTMIRHGDESSNGHYTLYLEYLGGLIPLLKGKRASKLRPEFVIFDPKIKTGTKPDEDDIFVSSESPSSDSDSDSDMVVEGCGSPRMQRKKRLKKLRERMERRDSTASQRPLDELLYDDNLPETGRLVEVTSNIWGTKFKIHGLASFLPEDLGQVLYKTSLLHLQPRQMTISILELTSDLRPQARDPNYNPNAFSESEDEMPVPPGFQDSRCGDGGAMGIHEEVIPISPETYAPSTRLNGQCSSDTMGTTILENGAMEVPVIIERHSLFQPRGEKTSCSPFEIRSLDGSPPQRRSPSLKSRSLSPAEQVTYTSNTLVDWTLDGSDMFTREMCVDKGAIPKVRMNNFPLPNSNDTCESDTDCQDAPASPRTVVQMAAKKLQDAIQQCETYRENGNLSVPRDLSSMPRWADKHCQEIKYIDDDLEDTMLEANRDSRQAVYCRSEELSAREIMRSTQTLADMDQPRTAGGGVAVSTSLPNPRSMAATLEPQKKRLILAQPPERKNFKTKLQEWSGCVNRSLEFFCRPDRTLGFVESPRRSSDSSCTSQQTSASTSPVLPRRKHVEVRRGSLELKRAGNSSQNGGAVDVVQSTSLPTSPIRKVVVPQHKRAKSKQELSVTKHKVQSPLPRPRTLKNYKAVDSSDEEVLLSGDEVTTSENYKNLETFQKAQLSKKLRKVRTKSDSERDRHRSPSMPRRRQFVMHNKAPLWNENSQVYQLDFGGRVTQESAKNFQIEFRGKQVMQFGRIDGNAYTLDFQYPFSAIQAFSVALANVTQRLK